MTTNPNHLDRHHPVRVLLEHAATAREVPTQRLFDDLLIRNDLPEGSNLERFRQAIARGCAEVARIAQTGDQADARNTADDLAAALAARMRPGERALTETHANPEPIADIGARMFGPQ